MTTDVGLGYGLTQNAFVEYVLVAVRCSAMLFTIPIFSGSQVPAQVRLALSLMLAFVVVSTLPHMPPLTGLGPLAIAVISQMFVGLVFGYVAGLVFAGLQFTGEIIDTQVGFAVTNIINPLNGNQVTVLGTFELAIATLIFLGTNGHHALISGMVGSFHLVPLPYISVAPELMTNVGMFFFSALSIVFKLGAPIAVALFIATMALALMARVAPQINVYYVGLPFQLGLGLVLFGTLLPLFGYVLPMIYADIPHQLDITLRSMASTK